ncbi:MAG: hypothetical protein GY826_12305 [Fuerstiella sp.]|nr:hypothetical protein [Fuerstiella sp.]
MQGDDGRALSGREAGKTQTRMSPVVGLNRLTDQLPSTRAGHHTVLVNHQIQFWLFRLVLITEQIQISLFQYDTPRVPFVPAVDPVRKIVP